MIKLKNYNNLSKTRIIVILLFVSFLAILFAVYNKEITNYLNEKVISQPVSYNLEDIPEYNGNSYIVINNNKPNFTDDDYSRTNKEYYSNLDSLGRCGVAFAKIGIDTMPIEKRGSIGMIKPSGWHTIKYNIVSGKYLYNRCHLIGYQLTGENANPKNLITCTRYMNTVGMLEFENMVADYVNDTKNHVLYRVTPIFRDSNLLAEGVLMEAKSVEDDGKGISFNVYVYNVQEGISINYQTGESSLAK